LNTFLGGVHEIPVASVDFDDILPDAVDQIIPVHLVCQCKVCVPSDIMIGPMASSQKGLPFIIISNQMNRRTKRLLLGRIEFHVVTNGLESWKMLTNYDPMARTVRLTESQENDELIDL
jgi:hypothetical protein